MGYLSEEQLSGLGFKSLGRHVLISDKASIYNAEQLEIGDYSRIDDFCVISGKVRIGRNVHIAIFCNIAGGVKGVDIGDFSGVAYGCHVFSQCDDFSGGTMTNPTVPAKFKQETKKAVIIGRHVLIGTSSLVLPGVTLAEGTAVSARSMVTASTEPWSLYFGCPAKWVGSRKKDLLKLEVDFLVECP
jgi:acetyltransferase-like isoleucine patch superfamily enzyme